MYPPGNCPPWGVLEFGLQAADCNAIKNSILGLYWDNGKENGNYYSMGFRVY